jgi:hypothetical protein
MVRAFKASLSQPGSLFFRLCGQQAALSSMTHSRSLGNVKEEFLTDLSHIPFAILALVSGWSRWIKALPPNQRENVAGWIWPVWFVLTGHCAHAVSRKVTDRSGTCLGKWRTRRCPAMNSDCSDLLLKGNSGITFSVVDEASVSRDSAGGLGMFNYPVRYFALRRLGRVAMPSLGSIDKGCSLGSIKTSLGLARVADRHRLPSNAVYSRITFPKPASESRNCGSGNVAQQHDFCHGVAMARSWSQWSVPEPDLVSAGIA